MRTSTVRLLLQVIGAVCQYIWPVDDSAIGINAALMRRVLLAHMQHHDVTKLHVTGRRELLHMPGSFDLVEQVPLPEIYWFDIKCHRGTSDASVVFKYPLHILSGNTQRVVGEFLIENIAFREVHEEAFPVFGIIGVFKEHLHDFLCGEMLIGVLFLYGVLEHCKSKTVPRTGHAFFGEAAVHEIVILADIHIQVQEIRYAETQISLIEKDILDGSVDSIS